MTKMIAVDKEAISKAKARVDRAKAALSRVESRAAATERKIDTRRCIIVGRLVLHAFKEEKNLGIDSAPVEGLLKSLVRHVSDRDRALFSDLIPPPPPSSLPISSGSHFDEDAPF